MADLASYDAGKETATAVQTAFEKVNSLTSTLNAIPGIEGYSPSSDRSEGSGGLGAVVAEERQAKLLLAASKRLASRVGNNDEGSQGRGRLRRMKSDGRAGKAEDRLEEASLAAGLAPL